MSYILEKISLLVFRFHKGILIALGLLTLFTTILIFRIDIKTDILDALPTKNPTIDIFVEFLNDFGSIDNLVVVLKSKDKKVDNYIELAESIGKKLKDSPLIEYVDYNILNINKEIFAKNFPLFLDKYALNSLGKRLTKEGIEKQISQNKIQLLSPISTPLDSELTLRDPLNLRSIVLSSVALGGSNKINTRQGYYISGDNSMLLIFVKPFGSSRDIGFIKKLKMDIDRIFGGIVKEYGKNDDLQMGLAGPCAFAIEAHETVQKDVLINAVTSAMLVFLLFQFVYKKKFLVLAIAGVTLLMALSWTLGIAYLIFGGLNIASSVVTAMLMGLGIDYIVHIFSRYESEFLKTGDMQHSLTIAITRTGPGVVTGALTTSAAFFSIVVTSFKGLYQLGIVAGIGVLASLFSTLLVMTSLIIVIENYKKGLLFKGGEQKFSMEGIGGIIKDFPRSIIFTGVLLMLVSLIGLSGIRFDNNPESLGPKKSQVMLMDNEIAEHFGKQKNPLMITVMAENKEGLMKRYDDLETIIDRWEEKGIIAGHSGLRLYLPPLNKQAEAISTLKEIRRSLNLNDMEKMFLKGLKENDFVVSEQYAPYIKGIQTALETEKPLGLEILESINDKKIRYFYNSKRLKIAAYLYPRDLNWDDETVSLLQKEVERLGNGIKLTGTQIMFTNLKSSIIRESIYASGIAFIIIFIILYIQFRALKWVFLVLVPLLFGFILTIGFMGLTGIKFNYINIGAISLLFGIGIDYGVYILQEHLEKREKSTEASIKHVGKAVIMCAMTTIAGFGSLMTMEFKGIATLGAIITIGVVACLISALFLLPVLIYYIDNKPCEGK